MMEYEFAPDAMDLLAKAGITGWDARTALVTLGKLLAAGRAAAVLHIGE